MRPKKALPTFPKHQFFMHKPSKRLGIVLSDNPIRFANDEYLMSLILINNNFRPISSLAGKSKIDFVSFSPETQHKLSRLLISNQKLNNRTEILNLLESFHSDEQFIPLSSNVHVSNIQPLHSAKEITALIDTFYPKMKNTPSYQNILLLYSSLWTPFEVIPRVPFD